MFDPSALLKTLLASRIQSENSELFQTVKALIDATQELNTRTSVLVDNQGTTNILPAINKSTLLGRRSSSAGTAEQISLGTNLSMVGNTLNASGGGSSRLFWQYKVKTTATSGYPGDGYILYDNASQILASHLLISHLTSDNLDVDILLSLISVGATILLQDSNVSGNFQSWQIIGSPTNFNPSTATSYWSFPIKLLSSAGTGTTGFPNNHQLLVIVNELEEPDYVVLSDGHEPPTPIDNGAGSFIYVGYTP